MIEVERFDPETGSSIGTVSAENLSMRGTFKLMGGCDTAVVRFFVPFGDAPPVEGGDAVVIRRNHVAVFSGRCRTVEPQYGTSVCEVHVEGWWHRIAERPGVEPALLDHITFGTAEGSDYPAIKTAFGVFQWIASNRVANDPSSLINVNLADTALIQPPTVPAKLAGPFVLYAKDDLTKVLSVLATMEDCVTGVDADGRLYYLPRDVVQAKTLMTVVAVGDPPADWRQSMHGVPTGGGRFVYDRRGPNSLSIFSRSINARNAIRDYRLVTDMPPGTVRSAGYRASNIHTGVQARRLARGLFRRFSNFHMKVESLEVRAGTMRFEPHLGRVRVVDSTDSPFAEDLCGTIDITFDKTTISASITIGENAADPGSDIPLNDPWASDPGWFDEPQIDTGDGEEDEAYTIPSGEIDFGDGWDGDGDDFHQNPSRETPMEDPPAGGVEGVDYGDDLPMSQDPGLPQGEPEVQPDRLYLGSIIQVNAPSLGQFTYNVQLYKPDGSLGPEQLTEISAWPDAYFQLEVGQKVLVVEPQGEKAYVDGTPANPLWPGRITNIDDPEGPTVEVLSPTDFLTTVLGTFTKIETFPPPVAPPVYTVGQMVTLAWFNNQLVPVILQTGGGSVEPPDPGPSQCAYSINAFGVKFG